MGLLKNMNKAAERDYVSLTDLGVSEKDAMEIVKNYYSYGGDNLIANLVGCQGILKSRLEELSKKGLRGKDVVTQLNISLVEDQLQSRGYESLI